MSTGQRGRAADGSGSVAVGAVELAAADIAADPMLARNGWTPETLAAYRAEREAAAMANMDLRHGRGTLRGLRATLAGQFPRLRFAAVEPAVDDQWDYQRGTR